MTTKYTFCRICEATCGLKIDVENNLIQAIEPDREHVTSKGFVCVKGTRFAAVQHSPDRITAPQKRVGEQWITISWQQAMAEIGAKMKQLKARHGSNTIGHFVGSPGGANVMAPMFRNAFYKAIGSHRLYGTPSTDTVNKFRVNEDMYGSPFYLAFPDVNNTSFLMVIGANPTISGNSLYHLPHAQMRMRDIVKRGGRVVFVNPRRTESAQAGEHVFIRPDTDVYFLAAFINEMIAQGGVDENRINQYMSGFDVLEKAVAGWTPERQEKATGVPAKTLREMVAAHAAANGAALYMSTGVNQGRSGSLCFWLLEAINAISGNLDRRGGTLMGKGLFDMPKQVKEKGEYLKKFLRDDGYPLICDNHPSNLLADDIENDREDRLTALVVEASNPLLACGNPNGRLEKALSQLELIVMVDLFRNETANLAHYILPAPSWMERPDIPYALQSFCGNMPTPYMAYSDPVLEAPEGVRHEWWIYSRLAEAASVTMFGSKLINLALRLNTRLAYAPYEWLRKLALTPEKMLGGMLKQAGLGNHREFMHNYPHGKLLEDNMPGSFLGKRVLTDNGEVNLAPQDFVDSFNETVETLYQEDLENRDRFKLISKRELRRMNSWMCNSETLGKEESNYLYIHPDDAEDLNLRPNDRVAVSSRSGRIEIPVRISDEVMQRCVAIPHGWGHGSADGLSLAQRRPGVNSNLLAGDGPENTEKLSGMSHLSGILVDIEKAAVSPIDAVA
ncbi:MAG: molybdopterin-containing oxidoreductase family protein [Pseudomonadales bacterium]